MSTPVSTSERVYVGVSASTTVSVYHNGVRIASIGVNLLSPAVPITPSVADRVIATEGPRVAKSGIPGSTLTVDTTEVTSASAAFTIGFPPVVTFVREVIVTDSTRLGEVVHP